MGFSQPLIGTFSIPVGALKTKAETKRKEALRACDEILAFLQGQIQKSGDEMNNESNLRSKSQVKLSGDAAKLM